MKVFFRKLHRWLGLLMALQITAWMASGLYFSIFPIDVIRGEHLIRAPEPPRANELSGAISPDKAWQLVVVELPEPHELRELTVLRRWGDTWYRISGTAANERFRRLVNVHSGDVLPALDAGAVRTLAQERLLPEGVGVDVQWVDSAPPASEIRGRDLPLWRVSYQRPEAVSLYFDPWTGDLVASRTTRWRIFDFLWMLHIMDFDERDDFNTPLLQVAAALALLVAISGLVFWAMTTRLLRRRRLRPS